MNLEASKVLGCACQVVDIKWTLGFDVGTCRVCGAVWRIEGNGLARRVHDEELERMAA